MTAQDVVRETAGPVGALGAVYFFHPATRERAKAAGIRPLGLYFLGRGGTMGDVSAAVVSSAFGYFHPENIAHQWASAQESMSPGEAADLALACGHDIAREALADVAGLDAFCSAAELVIDSWPVDGPPLFAAFAALPRPDDLAARAYQDVIVLRELRGSIHLAIVAASGVAPVVAHAHRRPDDVVGFGWPEDAVPAIADDDLARHRRDRPDHRRASCRDPRRARRRSARGLRRRHRCHGSRLRPVAPSCRAPSR